VTNEKRLYYYKKEKGDFLSGGLLYHFNFGLQTEYQYVLLISKKSKPFCGILDFYYCWSENI